MIDQHHEWLETDGRGGYASGTSSLIPTRKYHGLVVTPSENGGGRQVLCNGVEAYISVRGRQVPLSSFRYGATTVHPDGNRHIARFTINPWPTWEFDLDGLVITHEIALVPSLAATVLMWRVNRAPADCLLTVRPLLSGRDYHALHRRNNDFDFSTRREGAQVSWQPYTAHPRLFAWSNGEFVPHPAWYDNFHYDLEAARGFPAREDLGSPGLYRWQSLTHGATLVLSTKCDLFPESTSRRNVRERCEVILAKESERRKAIKDPLERASEAYLITHQNRNTIIAGYPWFTDWGRDTFIALRGLCLATDKRLIAKRILLSWAHTISEGMIPNRFPDQGGEAPEFNSVDASLWYVIAISEFLSRHRSLWRRLPRAERNQLIGAAQEILQGYYRGTRYGIRADDDGLLAAGQPGVQLTWMDARIGDWVVTPRIGKPVEIQALWINALRFGTSFSGEWLEPLARAQASFVKRFWNAERSCLFDVIDCDHQHGKNDDSIRPNQIFAVGGLPASLLEGERAALIVGCVERELYTPLGLRTLAPGEPGYCPRYQGSPAERDGAYHQGTVWPWLLGPFIEAWVRVHGNTSEAKDEAGRRFLEPLLKHRYVFGLGHLPEIADGSEPHTPHGCPFQAWSLGEALRVSRLVLSRRGG